MGYLYFLTNKENGKIFLGKSRLDKKMLRKMLFQTLRKKKHYNKLLQKDFEKYTFELEFQDSDDIFNDFDKIVREKDLLDPLNGYNVFHDLQNKKGRKKNTKIVNEDLCILYIFNPKVQMWSRTLDIERNTLSNRLGNFGLFTDGYYSHSVARYEDFYYTALRLLYLEGKCITANSLLDKMMNKYDVSTQLRITPRKISKFFAAHKVKRLDTKKKGSLIFCPGRRDDIE